MTTRVHTPDTFAPSPAIHPAGPEEVSRCLDGVQIRFHCAHRFTCSPAWNLAARTIPDTMWFTFLEGTGTGWLGRTRSAFRYSPGDLLLLPCNTPHSVRPDRGQGCSCTTAHCTATLPDGRDFFSHLGLQGLVHPQPGEDFIPSALALCREWALQEPGWRLAARGGIEGLILRLLRRHGDAFSVGGTGGKTAAHRRLAPALKVFRSRLSDPSLRMKAAAEALRASEVTLRKLFQEAFGVTPVAWLRERRVARACELLRTSDEPIKQIGAACGFADTPFFYQVFRRVTGTTPRRYRDGNDL